MNDSPNGERSTTSGILRGIDSMWIPPGIQPKCHEFTIGFSPFAFGRLDESNPMTGIGKFLQLDFYDRGFAEDFDRNRLVFRWVVVLLLWEIGVFSGLKIGELVELALQVGIPGVGN